MSLTKVRFALCLLLLCSTAVVVPATAQHFQQMNGSVNAQVVAFRLVPSGQPPRIDAPDPGHCPF